MPRFCTAQLCERAASTIRPRRAHELELDEWKTENGEHRSRHKVVAEEVEFLDRRREGREGEEDR